MKTINNYIIEKLHIDKNAQVKNGEKELKCNGDGNKVDLYRGFPFGAWNNGRFTFMMEYCKYFIKNYEEFNLDENDVDLLLLLKDSLKYKDSHLNDTNNAKILYDMIKCVLKYNIGPLTQPRTDKLNKMLRELSSGDIEKLEKNLTWEK